MEATRQLQLWTSRFGAEYTDRNDVEAPVRAAAWKQMLEGLQLERVLEVGCNVGWNLTHIAQSCAAQLYGVEPQDYAVERARAARPEYNFVQGNAFDLPFEDAFFDLSFTCGVLIHVHRDDLPRALSEVYRVSRRYVLYCEYDAGTETEIHYRGNDSALWKRDHSAIWREHYPQLQPVRSGFWGEQHGFDDCTWSLFEKHEVD